MESKSKVGTRAQRTPIIMHLYCLKMLPFFMFFSVQKKKWMDGWMDGWVRACVRTCVRVCVCVCYLLPKSYQCFSSQISFPASMRFWEVTSQKRVKVRRRPTNTSPPFHTQGVWKTTRYPK